MKKHWNIAQHSSSFKKLYKVFQKQIVLFLEILGTFLSVDKCLSMIFVVVFVPEREIYFSGNPTVAVEAIA